jgi:hypothetical protein
VYFPEILKRANQQIQYLLKSILLHQKLGVAMALLLKKNVTMAM